MTKQMVARFPGKCSACNGAVQVGQNIVFTVEGATKRVRHASVADCMIAKQEAVEVVERPKLELTKLVDFIKAAQARGLKAPKLRVLAPDRQREMRFSLTKRGADPGSVAVTIGHEFYGTVRTDGRPTGLLAPNAELQAYIVAVATNPVKAAQEYAALMGRCSFCDKELTDEGSVEVGYGPICASKWGLPHKPKGTPAVHVVPAFN